MAERKNHYLVETARTLLLHHKVPQRFWGDVILATCYLINHMSSSVLHDQIPHSVLLLNQPLFWIPSRVFGCICFVRILTLGQNKLSAKAIKCVFLGYSPLQRGYLYYSPDTNRYFISVDVTFFEDSSSFAARPSVPNVLSIPLVLPSPDFPTPPINVMTRPLQVYTCRSRPRPRPSTGPRVDSSLMLQSSPALVPQSSDDLPIVIRKGIHFTSNPHLVYKFLSFHRLSLPYSVFASTLSSVSTPKSTSEALSHLDWKQAMAEEMNALYSNGTWELVALPPSKSLVGCRWVYIVKMGPDGKIDRLKARLVAKGYTQQYGSDYYDTFSPVAKIASVRLLLSMVAMRSWPLVQLDIKNVFLHSHLGEDVYMEQPLGFVAQGESGLVCKLRRSLYGLKQSSRAWFSWFSSVVQEFGMIRSAANHSVFYHHSSTGQCIYLIVYVDDIVITGND